MYYYAEYSSPMGKITIATDEENVKALWFRGQKYFRDFGDARETKRIKMSGFIEIKEEEFHTGENCYPVAVLQVFRWLDQYFDGQKPSPAELQLKPAGGAFRQMVWNILKDIPYGETVTYGEIAEKVAKKMGRKTMSAQAVGGAVAKNPVSVIIPCHRVVGSNGSLTGYAGGIDKKIQLLELEGVDMKGFFVPRKGTAL